MDIIIPKAWDEINWGIIREKILREQIEIFEATVDGNQERVRELQYKLINNPHNSLLATRRITQDNKGRRTPGVDGIAGIEAKH